MSKKDPLTPEKEAKKAASKNYFGSLLGRYLTSTPTLSTEEEESQAGSVKNAMSEASHSFDSIMQIRRELEDAYRDLTHSPK